MELTKGMKTNLGEKSFSESEIIHFAKQNDPLDFHLSQEAAAKSQFKGLVTSGSQAFNYFYAKKWVPLFGDTVAAGLSVQNWFFKLPIYVGERIMASCEIGEIKDYKDSSKQVICWHFSFKNVKNEEVQSLELTILHRKS